MLVAQANTEAYGKRNNGEQYTQKNKKEGPALEAYVALVRGEHAVKAVCNGPARARRPEMQSLSGRGALLRHFPVRRIVCAALGPVRWLRLLYFLGRGCHGGASVAQ